MDIKAIFDTAGTEVAGYNGRFIFKDNNSAGNEFCKNVILHIPNTWEPEVYRNNCGEKILSVKINGCELDFMHYIGGARVNHTVAPAVYDGGCTHFIAWDYDNDCGYYDAYRKKTK